MTKTFYIDREITNELATEVDRFCQSLEAEDVAKFIVNSNGGSVTAGFAIYDSIKALSNETQVHIIGAACSAATYACCAADHCSMSPTGTYFIHCVQGWLGGTINSIKRDLEYMTSLEDRMYQMYAAKAQFITAEQIIEMVENETYMTAQQALDYGFVDEVQGLTRQPVNYDDNEEEQEEPKEEPKKDEGFVNRILSIFNKPKEDDIIKAPTELEIATNEEIVRLSNEIKSKDVELENLHKSLTLKEEEFDNRVAETEARLAEQAQAFNAERVAKESEYENKLKNLEDAV